MLRKLSDIVRKRNNHLIKQYKAKEAGEEIESDSISTGLLLLDSKGLLQKGILTVLGGDPGVGKTAWAIQFLKAAAEEGYRPIGFFFEDPLPLLSDRVTSQAIGESAFKLRRLELVDDDIANRLSNVASGVEWLDSVSVEDTLTTHTDLLVQLEEAVDETTGLVVIDYAQAFDAEPDEKSVERVIARLAWGLSQFAKKHNIAIVLFSQLKAEINDRGNRWFENFRFKTQQEPTETSWEAVEGFRPRDGDLQWSSALRQRAKQIVYIFRPAMWLQAFGVLAKDDFVQIQIAKGNYGPNKNILQFGWNGETARIFERKKKA
jgi:replicative DNA helicase